VMVTKRAVAMATRVAGVEESDGRAMATARRMAATKRARVARAMATATKPTPEPTSEPTLLVLKEDIVVREFMHSCAPSLNLAR
jgi:hypothetical protein